MLDFGVLPPEVNSGRLYAGPGSGPMLAAASAWDALASQLESASHGYAAVILGLQGQNWSGGASIAMAQAAAPYIEWVAVAGSTAEETASQARAAAAAYEAAFAATVPPALVAANRIQFAALVATNIFGQNTTQIAAKEAAYAQMWAQDAQAIYGYAGSSSAAATLTQFGEPPQTTTAAARPMQGAAVAHASATSTAGHSTSALSGLMSNVPQQLQTFSAPGSSGSSTSASSSTLSAFSDFNTLTAPVSLGGGISRTVTSAGSFASGLFRANVQAAGLLPEAASQAITGGAKTLAAGPGGPVLASVGQAAPIGGLSVPHSWASATPVANVVDEPQWMSEMDLAANPLTQETAAANSVGAAPIAGMGPMASMVARHSVSSVLRVAPRQFKMPRPALGG
jgi:PPE-repeat protein